MNRQKALMKKYLSRQENRYCADCKRPSPTWASLNLGVFVCIKCSGCHREIGVHITKIKSVELDLWPSKALTDFSKINNEIANSYWEYDLKNFDYQRIRDNEIRLIEFIRDKYEFKRWAKPRVPDPMSLVIQGRDLVKEFANNGEVVKIYEKSEEPELEKRSQHFGKQKNEKKGKSFGIVDRRENNNINNNQNNINTNAMNNNQNNNNPEKGFNFIKRKQNNNNNNSNNNIKNNDNNSNNNNNNNVDLLGFGNDQNKNNTNNINSNQINIGNNNNNFPMDIFSIGNNQTNLNNNNNSNSNNINNNNLEENKNQNNIFSNNIQANNNINNTNNNNDNKSKSGFSFIKKKNNTSQGQNNPVVNPNDTNINNPVQNSNINNINDIFNIIQTQNNNIKSNIENTNISNPNQNNQNNTNDTNNQNNTNNNLLNIFEEKTLVDLFNIETPTSDTVLNLSKNLLDIYSQKEENNNSQQMLNPNNPNSSNYNVLNMNYPNININNYYPNEIQNKNKVGTMNNNYAMNPMMGYNYQPQPYMSNNYGFFYGYGMNNMNTPYMNMGMNMNNGPINPGYNYQVEFYKDTQKEKDEPKPILLTNNKGFDLNIKKEKTKKDPFENLVNFK